MGTCHVRTAPSCGYVFQVRSNFARVGSACQLVRETVLCRVNVLPQSRCQLELGDPHSPSCRLPSIPHGNCEAKFAYSLPPKPSKQEKPETTIQCVYMGKQFRFGRNYSSDGVIFGLRETNPRYQYRCTQVTKMQLNLIYLQNGIRVIGLPRCEFRSAFLTTTATNGHMDGLKCLHFVEYVNALT